MLELVGTSANFSLVAMEDGRFAARTEAIIVVSEPHYAVDLSGQIIKSRDVDAFRFSTGIEGLEKVAKAIGDWIVAAKDLEKSAQVGKANATKGEQNE